MALINDVTINIDLRRHLKESLDRYFDLLENTGYAPKSMADSLVAIAGIDYFMRNDRLTYNATKELAAYSKALGCLLGKNCVIRHVRTHRAELGES